MALSAALAIIAGVILVAAGLLRPGFVTNFLPEPALVGFLFGMALIIVVRQAGKLVGVSTGEGDFFERAWHLLSQIDQWGLATMAVGLGAVATLLALERLAPKVPASLVVLIAGIALSALLDLEGHGVETVGHIPSAVPTPAIPDVSGHEVAGLLGGVRPDPELHHPGAQLGWPAPALAAVGGGDDPDRGGELRPRQRLGKRRPHAVDGMDGAAKAGGDHRGGKIRLLRPPNGVERAGGLEAAAAVDRPAELQLGVVRPGPGGIQVGGGRRSGRRIGGQPRVVQLVPLGGQHRCAEGAAAIIGRHTCRSSVLAQTYSRPLASKVTVGSRPLAESSRPPRLRQLTPPSKEA